MSKLFKFLPVLAIVAGLVGAFGFSNVQSECEVDDHIGYSYSGTGNPPLPFNPSNPLPAGLTSLGQYGTDFDCSASGSNCHWVYVPASGGTAAHWIQCTQGAYNAL